MGSGWPSVQDIRGRLDTLIGSADRAIAPSMISWIGTTYRFASRTYADRDRFTDGEGARRSGGRFTTIGGPRTLYLSLARATATAELDSWYSYYSIPDTAFQPRILAAVAVCAGWILNLTTPETLSELALSPSQIAEEWRFISDSGDVAPTQVFGSLVHEAGCEGILFPSARHESGINLALFPDNYRDGSHAMMLNSE